MKQKSRNTYLEDTLAMLSSVSWAIYTITNSDVVKKYGGLVCTCIMMSIGALLLLPIILWQGTLAIPCSYGSIAKILYLGVFSCGAAYLAWAQAGNISLLRFRVHSDSSICLQDSFLQSCS